MARQSADGRGARSTSKKKPDVDEEAAKPSPSTQEIRLAEFRYAALATQRKRIFRSNLQRLLRHARLSISQAAEMTGVKLPLLNRWLATGVSYDKSGSLEGFAAYFGIADPQQLFEATFDPRTIDIAGSPGDLAPCLPCAQPEPVTEHALVGELRQERPALFECFNAHDWDQLEFELSGIENPDRHAILRFAERVRRNHDLERRFTFLLETSFRPTLEQIIDVMFEAAHPRD